ncbi:uncharacterized protein [Amphiura filiformis]|uniref:uncharacterized protein n=1 Tax=Amphiura filiformis TaxID=82378 RepID=UPI003B217835
MEESNFSSTDSNEEEVTTEYTGTLVPCNECNLWFPTETSLERHHCTNIPPLKVVEDLPTEHAQSNENTGGDVNFVKKGPGDAKSAGFECDGENIKRSSNESKEQVVKEQVQNQIPSDRTAHEVTLKQNNDTKTVGNQIHASKINHGKYSKNLLQNYMCSRCTPARIFASSKSLLSHDSRCHVQELEHSCHSCGHKFKKTLERAKSIRTVYTQTNVDGWMCEVCGKTLSSFDEMQQHKLISKNENCKKQTPQDRFVCKYCAKTFQFQCQMHHHELVHTGSKPYQCPHCPKSFRLKRFLNIHVNIHTKQTIYSCGECGENFYLNSSLHRHMRSKHQEWKYMCSYCQKRHVTKADMLEHERTHTGFKPYICEECGAAFPRKQSLRPHLRAHRNERPFPCATCGKAFFRKSTLKEHFRTHSGEKPYQCQRCHVRFRQHAHLKAHLRSHLRMELQKHQPVVNECNTVKIDASDSKMKLTSPDNAANADCVDSTGLQNQNAVSETTVECVVYVENDNSGSDVQTAEESVKHDENVN